LNTSNAQLEGIGWAFGAVNVGREETSRSSRTVGGSVVAIRISRTTRQVHTCRGHARDHRWSYGGHGQQRSGHLRGTIGEETTTSRIHTRGQLQALGGGCGRGHQQTDDELEEYSNYQ